MITALLILLVVISLILIWLLKSLGLFKSIIIQIAQPPFDQLTIAYKFQCGSYSKSGEIFKDISKYSSSLDMLGIYYDNPKTVC